MQNGNLFDVEVKEYEEWFRINDQLLNSELEAIRPLLPASGKGIEIGVGTGIFASQLGIGFGVEPSEKMATEAIKKGIQVMIGTAEELPVEDESYQFALMVTVDCFLHDVPKAFSEVRRILIDQGIFIIAFLNRATPLGELYHKNKHLNESYKNANFHTDQEISQWLENTGFEILERKQTIYSLANTPQQVKDGFGEGVFAVIKARKKRRFLSE